MPDQNSEIEAYLAGMQKDFDDAKADDFHIDLPDNEYVWVISKAEVCISKGSSRLQAAFELTLDEGEKKGLKAKKYDGLDNIQNIGFFKKGLKALGIDLPKDARDYAKTVASMVGMRVKAKLSSKPSKSDPNTIYQNIYFQRAVADSM